MMKKDRFLAGFIENLHWRVELKKPRDYEDALGIARSKEWELQRMSQLGMHPVSFSAIERKQVEQVQVRAPIEVSHPIVLPVGSWVTPPMVITTIVDEGLR